MEVKSIEKISRSDLSALKNAKEAQRQVREPLLEAFDVYKSNVNYGVIIETEAEHNAVLEWYHKLCDLIPEAFENIPSQIERYLKG